MHFFQAAAPRIYDTNIYEINNNKKTKWEKTLHKRQVIE